MPPAGSQHVRKSGYIMKQITVSLALAFALMTSASHGATAEGTYYWLPPKGEARLISKSTNALVRRTVSPDRATHALADARQPRVWIDPKGNVRYLPR